MASIDLAYMDRLTQTYHRVGTTITIRTWLDGTTLVHEQECTGLAANAPIPGEVQDIATGILQDLALRRVIHKVDRVSGASLSVPYVLAQSAVPTILLPSATAISTTGAITGLTALPYVPSGVVRVYCFAQTGLAAGLYYATFSSTTACQLYTNAAGTVKPTGITAGAYAGGTSTAVLATISVPANAIGPSGAVRVTFLYQSGNNANTKTQSIYFGTMQVLQNSVTTLTCNNGIVLVRNRSEQSQVAMSPFISGTFSNGFAGANLSYGSVDTTQSQPLYLRGLVAVASDYSILEGYTVEILPGV